MQNLIASVKFNTCVLVVISYSLFYEKEATAKIFFSTEGTILSRNWLYLLHILSRPFPLHK